MQDTDDDLPLHAEAKAREKWRGGETVIGKGSENSGLPASEVDNAAPTAGAAEGPADGRPGKGGPGTIPPPD